MKSDIFEAYMLFMMGFGFAIFLCAAFRIGEHYFW